MTTVKQLPAPGLEVTSMRPPCIGHCDEQLEELQKPRTIVFGQDLTRVHDTIVNALQSPTGSSILGLISKYRYLLVAFVILLLLALHRVRQKRQAD